MAETCGWKHCRSASCLTWLAVPLCSRHWERVCELRNEGLRPAEIIARYVAGGVTFAPAGGRAEGGGGVKSPG